MTEGSPLQLIPGCCWYLLYIVQCVCTTRTENDGLSFPTEINHLHVFSCRHACAQGPSACTGITVMHSSALHVGMAWKKMAATINVLAIIL